MLYFGDKYQTTWETYSECVSFVMQMFCYIYLESFERRVLCKAKNVCQTVHIEYHHFVLQNTHSFIVVH